MLFSIKFTNCIDGTKLYLKSKQISMKMQILAFEIWKKKKKGMTGIESIISLDN